MAGLFTSQCQETMAFTGIYHVLAEMTSDAIWYTKLSFKYVQAMFVWCVFQKFISVNLTKIK